MHTILSTLFLFNPSSLIPSLLFWGMGIATIILDLWRKRREHGLGQRLAWYQRVMILAGIILILIGFMVALYTNALGVPLPQWLILVLPGVFLFAAFAIGTYGLFVHVRLLYQASKSPQEILAVGRIDSSQTSIVSNPYLLYIRMLLGINIVLLIIIIPTGIAQLSSLSIQHQLSFFSWLMLATVPLLVFGLIRMSTRLRVLLRIEHLRFSQTIKRNDASVLPISALPNSAPPLSIALRFKRTHIYLFMLLVIGLIVFSGINMMVQSVQAASSSPSGSISFIFFLVLGLAVFIGAFIPFFIVRYTIEASKIVLKTGPGRAISWQEAHLFVCYQLPDIIPGHSTTIYELSGSSRAVMWFWIRDPQSLFTIWQLLISPDAYHQQMQTLCDLVTTRTGLQLHDLTEISDNKMT